MNVLVVDDDKTLLCLMQEYFEDRGHKVFLCETQSEAMSVLEAYTMQLAVLDFHLGRENCKLLADKLASAYPEVVVVLTTGDHEASTMEEIRAMGVERVVLKPFRFREFTAAIEDVEERAKPEGRDPVRLTRYEAIEEEDLDELREVLRANPTDRNARWLLAFSFYRAGSFRDAQVLLEQIVQDTPENLLALYYLGACHYHFGDLQQALACWQDVHDLDAIGPLGRKLKKQLESLRAEMRQKREG